MLRVSMLIALLSGLLVLSADGVIGQEAKKKDDSKAATKDEPKGKLKGFLPQNWGKIGLSDDQKQQVYRIQAKYAAEIDQLEAKIKEMRATRDKELRTVLTPEQKKRLDDILTGKTKGK